MTAFGLTLAGISFIFLMTTLGSAVAFLLKNDLSKKTQAFVFGLASGIMIASSIWSLLLPALETFSLKFKWLAFLPAVCAFALGGAFLIVLDLVFPFIIKDNKKAGLSTMKSFRLFLAVTFHNIPEGLAVGFAFGLANAVQSPSAMLGGLGLAFGIGIQNFPEGMAVVLPMKTAIKSRKKAFIWGVCSGVVEPIFAVLGCILAFKLQPLQPWLLSASAGAMIFVTVGDLIPDTKISDESKIGAVGVMLGFMFMMALDVGLG